MSESALEAPRVAASATAGDSVARRALGGLTRGHYAWAAVTLAVIVVAAALIHWARTAPSYDAFGWLVWGYQTLHGHLDLGGAPSWKPLPFLFTLPYAVFPMGIEKALWQLTAVAVALAGALFAGRIAYRLTLTGSAHAGEVEASSRARHYSAIVAGVFAGLTLLGMEDYMHYILSVQSDPMIVTFVVAAIDCHLCGRDRWAFVLGCLASLGRPEAWPWLVGFSLWAWIRRPQMRWMILAGAALVLFMWFGIPWITNGRPFVSAQLALKSPRALHSNKLLGTLGRFKELEYAPVWIAALVGVAWGLKRRHHIVMALTVGVIGWVIVEIAFAYHGWPALPRYMMEAAGVGAVLAGVGVGWTLTELPNLRARVPHWVGAGLVALLIAACVPGAVARVRTERTDLKHERHRATQIRLLGNAIAALDGWRHIRHCAKPTANVEWVSALAWLVHSDVGVLGHLPNVEIHLHKPIVLFSPLTRGGWHIEPIHLHHWNYAKCYSLRSYFALAPGHPNGVLTRY